MSETVRRIQGKCHCGNIRFTFLWPDSGAKIPVRACSCTFCIKHGGVYTSHPKGQVDIQVENESLLTRYRFGTGTAEFFICSSCGVVPIVTSTIDGDEYAVVNVNSFEGVKRSELDQSISDFDGETTESRLARRKRNWIPNVSVKLGPYN
ncbi:MAG: hypothetical protein OEU36_04680 [Gammaproteobacteria bacterium]|nr:hypothetical protein [Gammaproteobacteria bacterium]